MAGDPSAAEWSPENAYGFFQLFRPTGEGVDRAFGGLPDGAEVVRRLSAVYRATDSDWQRGDASDAYFIVRRPRSATPGELRALAADHVGAVRSIAQLAACDELVERLSPTPAFEISSATRFDGCDTSDLGTLIFEAVGDWFGSLSASDRRVPLMWEAFYSIACDYDLARYLMWPWYRRAAPIAEPFAPYFELWRRGARVVFDDSLAGAR